MNSGVFRHIDIQAMVSHRIDRPILLELVHGELRRQKSWPNYQISIFLIDDRQIRALKARYFGIRTSTDVISLNYTTVKGFLEGEIHISLETARRQAREYRVTVQDEVRRLAVHGLLHLLGYTDDTLEERRIMADFESAALVRLKKRLTLI